MAEILRRTAAQYVQRYPQQAVGQVQSTLAKLWLCRTAALGGRQLQCGQCRHACCVYNSCGARHCPQCAGAKRSSWIDTSEQLILSGVDYYQVVFTLPSQLSRLALGNRTELYDLLFSAAWLALKQTIEAEQGFDPAALMILHTWNQKLEAHAHVHAVVPGGGPALHGGQWKAATEPKGRASGCYLVDAVALRQSFRAHFINGLRRLLSKEQLKLEGEFAYLQQPEQPQQLLVELAAVQWVSYIEPPPHEGCGPEQVLKYLARYLTGGPISAARLVRADERQVTFMAREGKVTGGQREQVPITLTSLEFTRRWALHILPKGYTKARRFGGWSNRRTSEYIERCALLLDGADVQLTPQAMLFDPQSWELEVESQPEFTQTECPHCGAPMQCVAATAKPSWQHIMNSPHRPSWYTRGRLKL